LSEKIDLSAFDRPEILETIFPIVYSPVYSAYNLPFSSNKAINYSIQVEEGINSSCGFWVNNKEDPTILYFHGNGETVTEQDWLATFYNQRGINLSAVDYRGNGSSDGKPTISNLVSDSHAIFKGFKEIISKEEYRGSIFLMGRSLGSIPAVELALAYQTEVRGLIIESGTANNFVRLLNYLKPSERKAFLNEENPFRNKVKMRQINSPSLIIHGGADELISVEEGKELYRNSSTEKKKLLIIPGAGHNDIMIIDTDLYFGTIQEFIRENV